MILIGCVMRYLAAYTLSVLKIKRCLPHQSGRQFSWGHVGGAMQQGWSFYFYTMFFIHIILCIILRPVRQLNRWVMSRNISVFSLAVKPCILVSKRGTLLCIAFVVLTLNCANYFIARRQNRCYRTVTLRNRGLTKLTLQLRDHCRPVLLRCLIFVCYC